MKKSDLQEIPGVGPATEKDLNLLGVQRIADLRDMDPQEMYDELCRLTEIRQDKCVLYVFHCAVYYANHVRHDPEKLKWWNWKDWIKKRD
jgi:hypothetical protein